MEELNKKKFYELAAAYFVNYYNMYTLHCAPVYDDFIEELEALDVDNIDYAVCDDTKDVFKVKKIDGVVSVEWCY